MTDTTAEKTTAKKTAAEKTTAKKTAAEKTTAEKTTAEKTTAEKTAAKKTAAKKTTAEKTAAKKTAVRRKTSTKKTGAKKTSTARKKPTPKKSAAPSGKDGDDKAKFLTGGAVVVAIAAVIGLYYLQPAGEEPQTTEVDVWGDVGSGDVRSGDEGSGDEGSGDVGSGDVRSGDEGSGDEGSGDEGSGDEPAWAVAPPDVAATPEDAARSESGLAWRVLREGTGDVHPTPRNRVSVHYSGWTTDGELFDSSHRRGEAASFSVGGVIAGWTEGLQLMVVGEKRRFWIPEALAYRGQQPPLGMLVFDVELISIQ